MSSYGDSPCSKKLLSRNAIEGIQCVWETNVYNDKAWIEKCGEHAQHI